KAVLAESFERIPRSNLIMMGILPLQFLDGETADSLGLTGFESYDIELPENPSIHDVVDVVARDASGEKRFKAIVRFDVAADIRLYIIGGIMLMVCSIDIEG